MATGKPVQDRRSFTESLAAAGAVALLLFVTLAISAAPARAFVVGSPYPLQVTPPPLDQAGFELPFWVVPGGWRTLSVSTHWTYSCSTPRNPLTEAVQLGADYPCELTSRDFASSQMRLEPSEQNPRAHEWGRMYNGTFTSHVVRVAGEDRVVSLNHGENKNQRFNGSCNSGGTVYWNTVNDDHGGTDGPCNGEYQAYWPGYHGLITMQWSHYDAAHNWGLEPQWNTGPIVWPVNGYLYGGVQSSRGVRHPHGLVDAGYMWMFYQDEGGGSGNLAPGIRLARAPVSGGALPGTWKTYCNGAWVDSLPPDFDQDPQSEGIWQLEDEWPKRGGCASPILPTNSQQISFAVARKSGAEGYYGIEETVIGSTWAPRLWESPDLTNWTFSQTLRTRDSGWSAGDLHYPVFLAANAWSNEVVDATNFYILGARGGRVIAMRVHS